MKKKLLTAKKITNDILNNKKKSRIYYVVEKANWVIKEEGIMFSKLIKELKQTTTSIGIKNSIIHFASSGTLPSLKRLKKLSKNNKIVLTWYHIDKNNDLYKKIPEINKFVDLVHTSCTISKKELIKLGFDEEKIKIIPIGINLSRFKKKLSKKEILELKAKLKIPEDKIIIGSFQKDGSGWGEGLEPKHIKGPDLFLKAIAKLKKKHQIHVLLTGPSRGYVKKGLDNIGVSYTHLFFDDYYEIVDYYQIIDLYIIASRAEGGPKALTECIATNTLLVSTDVGMVNDLPDYLKKHFVSKVNDTDDLVSKANNLLSDKNLSNKLKKELHETIKNYDIKQIAKKYTEILYKNTDVKIHICFKFKEGPSGGGNQFLKALKKYLIKKGVYTNNPKEADIILFNSYQYINDVAKLKLKYPKKVFIHRIDGPIKLYNHLSDKRDDIINISNKFLAEATIFQSKWSEKRNYQLGLKKNFYSINIINAPNPDIFKNRKKSISGKINLIATSWSSNMNKGFEVYKYLDQHLDFSRYTMTFVGNSPVNFKNIITKKPMKSELLAKELAKNDIYITASKADPCSNSLLEALHTGLPAVALNDGGHPEIIKRGGELFNKEEEIIPLIDKIVKKYDIYTKNIELENFDSVFNKYYDFMKRLKNVKTKKFNIIKYLTVIYFILYNMLYENLVNRWKN